MIVQYGESFGTRTITTVFVLLLGLRLVLFWIICGIFRRMGNQTDVCYYDTRSKHGNDLCTIERSYPRIFKALGDYRGSGKYKHRMDFQKTDT